MSTSMEYKKNLSRAAELLIERALQADACGVHELEIAHVKKAGRLGEYAQIYKARILFLDEPGTRSYLEKNRIGVYGGPLIDFEFDRIESELSSSQSINPEDLAVVLETLGFKVKKEGGIIISFSW